MTLSTVLTVAAGVLSGIAAAQAFRLLFSKQKAEKHLIQQLRDDSMVLQTLVQEERMFHNRSASSTELTAMIDLIQQQLLRLNAEERARVEEGLDQISLQGRRNYVTKILSEAAARRREQVPA
jgi:hypothetical protein